MPLGVPVVTFAVLGPARNRGTGRFMAGNVLDQVGATEYMELVGRAYEGELKQLWASKHGRTGETEESISGELTPGTGSLEASVYGITIAGNIGFVINPLPPHVIGLSALGSGALALGNPMTDQGQGRTTNFYSPFGPRIEVEWFQGSIVGGNSYGPDPQWYADLQPDLDAQGLAALNKLGAQVANIWAADGIITTRYAGNL